MLRAAALAAAVIPFGLLAVPAVADDSPWKEKAIGISKDGTPHEWPFSVESGELSCFIFAGRRMVFFREPDTNDPDLFFKGIPYDLPRSVIVSTNPLEIFASLEDADLFLPFDSDFSVLIRRLAPFDAMGQALCDELLAEEAGADGEDGGN